MDNFLCGGYIFASNFDSGNLHKAELAKWNEGTLQNNDGCHVEFNLWTKPDCAGTPYENLNRSWFFFSIQGGEPNSVAKLNIINLNKQAKLFSQGMQPVIRIGDCGKWERIRDNIKYSIVNGDYVLSFAHKPYMNTSTKYYYAFTYPYTYAECQDQLKTYDELYEKTEAEYKYIVQRLNVDVNSNNSGFNPATVADPDIEKSLMTDDTAAEKLKKLVFQSKAELENDIYYRREQLISSLEGRRIDLLTITSFHNICEGREIRLEELFPEQNVKRCQLFENKKVIFMSARVHPGETPASFILNGFLKMILDRKSRYAAVLRQMYVFKIIPFLNPDGVYNGCYRSDTMGHNLNRVYLGPCKDIHPSIYAVRKLIMYYHSGMKATTDNKTVIFSNDESKPPPVSSPNEIEFPTFEMDSATTSEADIEAASRHAFDRKLSQPNILAEINVQSKNNRNLDDLVQTPSTSASEAPTPTPSTSASGIPSSTSSSSETECESKPNCPRTKSTDNNDTFDAMKTIKLPQVMAKANTTATTVFNNEFIIELKPSISMEAPSQVTPDEANTPNKDKLKVKKMALKKCLKTLGYGQEENAMTANQRTNENATARPNSAICSTRSIKKLAKKDTLLTSSPRAANLTTPHNLFRPLRRKGTLDNNGNTATSARDTVDVNDDSNIFLYIDLHGHASKKGIFMYGNYLPDAAEAVECMLLPRLMSLNCLHFHFDACVFSERNMYHKGKRDGLSKEGSGRVAVYKAIGLIKCYTLEGNYNMGKCVNALPTLPKETKKYSSSTAIPPKFTPSIFEEVGRALGPSILDLTESNPLSRLRSSEFRNLQGLRTALRGDIERNVSKNVSENTTSKALRIHSKPICSKPPTACYSSLTIDGFKENKGRHATSKPQISFGKKEKTTGSALLTRKKGKMVSDSLASTSTTAPIPTKRPKVLPKKCSPIIDQIDTKDAKNDANLAISQSIQLAEAIVRPCTAIQAACSSTAADDLANKSSFGSETGSSQSTFTVDSEKPGCSYSLQPQTSQSFHNYELKKSTAVVKAGSFMRKSKSISTSKLFKQPAAPTSATAKHVASKMKRTTFGIAGASVGSRLKATLRRANLSPDGRRKRKKKSLKAELKRTVF